MPTRWLVEVASIDPSAVRLEELHAVAARWLDGEHRGQTKDWSISPAQTGPRGGCAFEVGTLTERAATRLGKAVVPGAPVRLGRQQGIVAAEPDRLTEQPWEELTQPSGQCAWVLDFVTPTTFRTGGRFAPWPAPGAVLRGLGQHWDHAQQAAPTVTTQLATTVWVSDLDGHNEVFRLNRLTVSGYLGRIRYECADPEAAPSVDRLIRLAPFAGVGAYTTRGLGVTRLEPTWNPRAR